MFQFSNFENIKGKGSYRNVVGQNNRLKSTFVIQFCVCVRQYPMSLALNLGSTVLSILLVLKLLYFTEQTVLKYLTLILSYSDTVRILALQEKFQ